jgi:glutathione S-transferase
MSDGFTLYESRAICKFLAAKYALPYLPPPSDLVARALFDQAESAEACHFSSTAGVISFEKFVKPSIGLGTDALVVDAKRKELESHFDVVDKILAKQEYMAGDSFGLVDIFYIPMVDRLAKCGEGNLVEGRKNVSAWWERCVGRLAVKKFLAEQSSLEDVKRKLMASKA